MTSGIFLYMFLPDWTPKWLIKRLRPKPRGRPQDWCDYELPPPRLIPNRLPITRPSTPCSLPAPKPGSAPGTHTRTPLLELLPLEIRRKIWLLVLGGQTLHLGLDEGQLEAAQCLSADPDECFGSRGEWTTYVEGQNGAMPTRFVGDHLRLLIVCRQIYTEAIDITYSSNTFHIGGNFIFEFLPLAILPQRLNTIRTLRLTCIFLGGPPPCDMHIWEKCSKEDLRILKKRQEKWLNIWRTLSQMTGLRQLHVRLEIGWEWEKLSHHSAVELLGPVKQVTKPDLFVLTLPFPAMYEGMKFRTSGGPEVAKGWEGSDPWDELPNCEVRRVE
ncbi:hypothetical protein VTL71DRAFT_1181 [Oculimacula yallundae]|uniref:DUF7730 domain-containing protein n=1 Tax=Oculimacula yallundae TaxID=86028 RepID=A0ABR4D3M2_9HELO